MLTPAAQADLKALVEGCVAFVVAAQPAPGGAQGERKRGTGFFIDATHLVTCGHVVGEATDVLVARLADSVSRRGRVLFPRPGNAADDPIRDADLALVEVDAPVPADPAQQAVLLDLREPKAQTRAFASGFPGNAMDAQGAHEALDYTARPRKGFGGGTTSLILEAGQKVLPGLSGAPLVDLDDGTVIGIVRWSDGDQLANGGGAIPVAVAHRLLTAVEDAALFPSPSTSRWRELLGPNALPMLGRSADATWSCLELQLGGKRSAWSVTMPKTAVAQPVTLSDLEVENAGKALFSWAQWQRAANEDLSVLGSVLGSALFRPNVLAAVTALRQQTSELRVRLLVDQDSDLTDVPWEYATVPVAHAGSVSEHVSTMSGVVFSRVVTATAHDPAEQPTVRVKAGSHDVRVLTVLATTDTLNSQPPSIADRLNTAVAPYSVKRLEPALLSSYETEANAGFDVIHYLGFGRVEGNKHQLKFFEDDEGTESWQDLDEVIEKTRMRPPRLFVVQLMTSDPTSRWDRVPLSKIAEVIGAGTEAVVGTRFPVDRPGIRMFNEVFYARLAEGATVEAAAQQARAKLKTDKPGRDDSAFGAMAVYTGRTGDVRLCFGSPPDSGDLGGSGGGSIAAEGARANKPPAGDG